MKTFRKISQLLAIGVLMMSFALNFNACSEQSPLSSTKESQFAQDNVQIIDLGDAFTSLNKGSFQDSAVVTPEQGGQLILVKGKAFEENGEIEIIEEDSLDILGFGKKSGVCCQP